MENLKFKIWKSITEEGNSIGIINLGQKRSAFIEWFKDREENEIRYSVWIFAESMEDLEIRVNYLCLTNGEYDEDNAENYLLLAEYNTDPAITKLYLAGGFCLSGTIKDTDIKLEDYIKLI